MGRPRTPTAILKARGTFRPDRAARNEAPVIGKPSCPKWLVDPDARREFKRLVKLLTAMGLLAGVDQNMLVRYCSAWVRYRRISQTLVSNPATEFATYKDDAGKVKSIQVSALHSIARSLAEELSKYEAAMGMSASSRSRIEVQMPQGPAADPINKFFADASMRIAK